MTHSHERERTNDRGRTLIYRFFLPAIITDQVLRFGGSLYKIERRLLSFRCRNWIPSLTKRWLPRPPRCRSSCRLAFNLWLAAEITAKVEMVRILALFCFPLLRERLRQTERVTDKRTNRRAGSGERERERGREG